MKINKNDVYSFRYNEKYTQKLFEPYRCFDGILVVREKKSGKLYLEDTFWSSENKTFTLEEALNQGHLEFILNLNDFDISEEYKEKYYTTSDFKILPCHHGYQKSYYLRKGAVKSKEKMLEVINNNIEELNRKKNSIEWSIELQQKNLKDLESGNLEIYI